MSLNAIEAAVQSPGRTNNGSVNSFDDSVSWVDRILQSMDSKDVDKDFKCATTVHPCIIDGERVLVYEKGLSKKQPDAYANLSQFAEENNFKLKQDERSTDKNVGFERRLARTMPILFLASGIFMQGATQAEMTSTSVEPVLQEMPEVHVMGKRFKSTRSYKISNGKRFVTEPYGDVESILMVASEAKRRGELKRISTRKITMPSNYIGGSINRYEYQFPKQCGGEKFSYYEGEGFGALGHHQGETIVLDVMVGGGPFSSPQLWGPYDQVLGDKHNRTMKLMMGSGKKDGMGLLKASYAIGMTPVMSNADFDKLGNSYVSAVRNTVNCLNDIRRPAPPVLRQAKNDW